MINVTGDLFGATLSGDVLSACQLRSATVAREADQVLRYQWHRPPRAFLPGGVGRRVHHDLTHDAPARMVRIAARDKKSRERLCHPVRPGLGPVAVEMSQCGADATPVINRPGELPRSRPRLASVIVDPCSVLAGRSPPSGSAPSMPSSPRRCTAIVPDPPVAISATPRNGWTTPAFRSRGYPDRQRRHGCMCPKAVASYPGGDSQSCMGTLTFCAPHRCCSTHAQEQQRRRDWWISITASLSSCLGGLRVKANGQPTACRSRPRVSFHNGRAGSSDDREPHPCPSRFVTGGKPRAGQSHHRAAGRRQTAS